MNASKKTMSNSALFSLPQEILIEILSKLPAKSLVRFKCVSKFFCSLVVDPFFTDLHRKWSLTLPRRMSILISSRPRRSEGFYDTPRFHYEINYSQENHGKLQAICVSYLDGEERLQNGRLGRTVNGLISLCTDNGDVAICNLSTRQQVFLPTTCLPYSYSRYCNSVFLGFDPVSKRYKILMSVMSYDHRNLKTPPHFVFTLGVDKSWREISCSCFCPYTPLISFFSHTSVYIDGYIYSLNQFSCGYSICAFDVGAENFHMISFSDELSKSYNKQKHNFSKSALVDLDGQLAFIRVSKKRLVTYMNIWTWKKAKEWKKSTTLIPLELSQLIDQAVLLRITSNHVGEIVILDIKDKCVLFYNFRRQIWRKFVICGLGDDLFNGFPSEHFINISVENLFSLE